MSDIKAEPWFDSKGHMDEDEPATPAEVEALKLFLAGELSIDAAARSIMSMDESQVSLEDKDFRLAWFLFEAKIRFVDRQDDILNLEDAIANIPDEELALTEGQKARYPDWSEWKKLDPCPGPMDSMRRSYWAHKYSVRHDDNDPRLRIHHWRDMNALLAKIQVREKTIQPVRYTVSIISDGLEFEPWTMPASETTGFPGTIKALDVSLSPSIPKGKITCTLTLEQADVPAAAIRLIIQGHLIYDFIAGNPEYRDFEHTTHLWPHGKPGLSLERWVLWKERLLWVQGQGELDVETREMAGQAHAKMVEVEGREAGGEV